MHRKAENDMQTQTIDKNTEQLYQTLPFSLASLTFHLVAIEPLELPEYKGSTFRGGFGHALKQVWCQRPNGKLCDNCRRENQCPYSYIFETPKAFGKQSHIRAANLPHPFVLTPPLSSKQHFQPEESFTFKLNLFGAGIRLVESFVYAFLKLGDLGIGKKQGRFQLQKVTNENGSLVWAYNESQNGQVEVINYDRFVEQAHNLHPQQIRLQFETTTGLLFHNRITIDISFEIFLRSLLRRASTLAEIHGGQAWQLDFKKLIDRGKWEVQTAQNALRWHEWQRYSNRQQRRHSLQGFVGGIEFRGTLTPFLPLILLGEYTHVGRQTSFGMGKYMILD